MIIGASAVHLQFFLLIPALALAQRADVLMANQTALGSRLRAGVADGHAASGLRGSLQHAPHRMVGMLSWLPPWIVRPHAQLRFARTWPDPDLAVAQFYGQEQEDLHLYMNYFFGVRRGFYLEMGALDGVMFSNTKFFHDNLGWRGLLIEPSPGSFAQLVLNRPSDLCVRAAICAKHGTVQYVDSNGGVSGILEQMTPAFRMTWRVQIDQAVSEGRVVPLPCMPMQALLDFHKIDKIDLWSLDAEGGELEVLQTIDFHRVDVHVILVEADGSTPERDAAIQRLLLASGFEFRGTHLRSLWFVNSAFRPQVAVAPSPPLAPAQGMELGLSLEDNDVAPAEAVEAAQRHAVAAAAAAAAAASKGDTHQGRK